MTMPKTLLEMAGAGPVPVSPEDTAVVMIDCQREYLDGRLALPGVGGAIAGPYCLQFRERRTGSMVRPARAKPEIRFGEGKPRAQAPSGTDQPAPRAVVTYSGQP